MSAAISTPQRTPFVLGLAVALFSAATFGSSGTFGSSLLATGWSPGAIVTLRITGAALIMLVPAVLAMRGHWHLLRRNALRIIAYGLFAVAGCQFAYFMAVDHLSVGVALLLEYLAPVLIVGWVWARHGRRPSRLTTAGVAAAVLGLVLVLDVASGARLDIVGVLWGLLAAVGLVIFFLVAADDDEALPPLSFAGGGLAVGAISLLLVAGVGLLPMEANTAPVDLAGWSAPWWVPIVELAIVAGAISYVTGIAAARLLGGTVASFVGLSEVLFAVVFAWLVVGEAMSPVQIAGGVAVLAGVVAVKLGEGERSGHPVLTDDVDTALVAASDDRSPSGLAESARVH